MPASSSGAVNKAALKGASLTHGACRNTGKATSNAPARLRGHWRVGAVGLTPSREALGGSAATVRLGETPITNV